MPRSPRSKSRDSSDSESESDYSSSSSRSRSSSSSRSRSRSPKRAAASPKKKKMVAKKTSACKKGYSSKGKQEVTKGYKIIAENIEMIPKALRQAYCRPCAAGEKGKMTPLDESKSKFVKMCNRDSYAIVGPCSKCGRSRCCFVKKVAGYA